MATSTQPSSNRSSSNRTSSSQAAHPTRALPTTKRQPMFDSAVQLDVIRDSLIQGEQIYGVYASESGGVAFVGVTNKRVILLDTAFAGGRAGLTTIPFSRITTLSYVSTESDPIFSRSIAIQVARTVYEVTCRSEQQAADIHDLITWHLLN